MAQMFGVNHQARPTSPSPPYRQPSPGYSVSPNPTYGQPPSGYAAPSGSPYQQPLPAYASSPNPNYGQQNFGYAPQQKPNYVYQPSLEPQPQPLPGYATSPNPGYGQQPSAPRVLHIYHEGMAHRHARIMDSDKQTQLYRIDENSGGLFSAKPHIKIFAANTGAQVGTVTFRKMSSDMDLTVHDRPTILNRPSFMTYAHEFQSVATGASFKWKRDGVFSGGDMLCLDQREQLVAKFLMANWAMKKGGKFELSPGVNGMLMDEIVTSGIAMVEWRRKQRAASSAAAGGAAC